MLADVHCHLDETFFKDDVDKVIENAKKAGLKAIVPAGVDPKTNRNALLLGERYPGLVYPALGIYPPDALKRELEETKDGFSHYDVDAEIEFISQNASKLWAIGEVGMDFKDGTDFPEQERIFRKLVELAIKIDKPLIIHSRKAEAKVIDILETYNYRRIVMHCFGGNHNLVQKIRDNKWLFSIPTSAVRDQHFQKIIRETPLFQILTETDSPFLSPFKEQRNEPANVVETVKLIAQLRNMAEEDVVGRLWKNTKVLFRI
ncbi:MAG: TatD family hydrolase [Nanoarchaeota archaeon]|nr:TatD family hydrolase [Nanoarchaeota archaeon]